MKKLTLPEILTIIEADAIPDCERKQLTVPTGIKEWIPELREGDVLYVTDLEKISESPVLLRIAGEYEIKELALNAEKVILSYGEKYPLRFNSGAKAEWKSDWYGAKVGKTGNIYMEHTNYLALITAMIYGKEYTCRVVAPLNWSEEDRDETGEQEMENFVIRDKVLVKYQGNESEVIVPDGVTVIGEKAFYQNLSVERVVLPEGVERIEEQAFRECYFLEEVEVPTSLRYIGAYAFVRSGLTHIIFPEGMERIEESAFSFCNYLTKVQLPDSLTYIGSEAFAYCSNLTDINLSGVKEIDFNAFFNARSLTYVDLSSLEKVTGAAFSRTDIMEFAGLTHVPEMDMNSFQGSRYYKEYGQGESENTFWIVDGVLLSGQCCKGAVQIPDTVREIAPQAFCDNRNITSVMIPDSVTKIGNEAFYFCLKLKTVRMEDSVTELGEGAFNSCPKLTDIRLSNRITIISDCFLKSWAIKSITLPEDLKEISQGMPFESMITMPAGIKEWDVDMSGKDVLYVTDMKQVSDSPVLQRLAKTHEIKELALNKSKLVLKVGEKYPLRFNNGAKAVWKTSDKKIANVGITGNIYAKKPGTAFITATVYGKKYTCKVTVVRK